MNKLKVLALNLILFLIMGFTYYCLEILFDGDSHWSMFVLGGICGISIGLLNEFKLTWDMPLWQQILWGEVIVLPLEFITECIVNIWLGLNVWDYSNLPFNILGQVSLLFALIFIPVIILAILIDDYFRWFYLDGDKPKYKLF